MQVPRIDLDTMLSTSEKAAPPPEYTTSGSYDPKRSELAGKARSASDVTDNDEISEN